MVQQEDRVFSRLLSRERYNPSKQHGGEASFRVLYYGGAAGSVPFLWESCPGTPKLPCSHDSPPPLTPPPSYRSSPRPGQKKPDRKKCRSLRSCLLKALIPSSKKIGAASSPAPEFLSASGSASSSSSSYTAAGDSPTSMLCFGMRRGCLKKAVAAIVGHGNGSW